MKCLINEINEMFPIYSSFRSIEAELSKFENIKDTSDYQIVIKFMYDVLRLIPFFSENLFKNQIKLIYP